MASLRRYFQLPGVVWCWPLSNQPLQEARDRHTVTGAPTVARGPWGPGLSFDGANDYVTLGAAWEDQLRFDSGAQDFSVVAWVRRGATAADHTILSKEDAVDDGWILRFTSADAVQFKLNATSAGATGTLTDALWHTVIATVDRSTGLLVYLDGVPGGGVALAGPAMATTTAPRIGARAHDASDKYEGDIAGLAVVNYLLSAAECLNIATGAF